MTEEHVDEMVIDVCHSCGGTWYDRNELEARLLRHVKGEGEAAPAATHESSRTPQVDQTEVKYLACPHCHQHMVRRNFGRNSGVIVDVCGYHGFFLDAGEFEKLVCFEEQDGSAKAADRDRRHAEMRAKEQRRDARAARARTQADIGRYRGSVLGLFSR